MPLAELDCWSQKVVTNDLSNTSRAGSTAFQSSSSAKGPQGDNRVAFQPVFQELQHLCTIQHTLISAETIASNCPNSEAATSREIAKS